MSDTLPPSNDTAYKSLLYWRKNLWNGAACVPVILTLEDGVLAMKRSDSSMVFSEPTASIAVRFTGWGTMVLTVGDKKYDIVGMPAATSPSISDLQKAELRGLALDDVPAPEVRDAQPVVLGGTVATATGGAGATIAGAVASSLTYYRGLASVRDWKTLIGSASDQKRQLNFMTYFIILMVTGLVVAIILK